MKYWSLLIPVFVFVSCENQAFDSDKRQIIAKNEISKMVPRNRSLTITRFQEDTLMSWQNAAFQRPIRYVMDFKYTDSTGAEKSKQGIIIFSQKGNAVIDHKILDR